MCSWSSSYLGRVFKLVKNSLPRVSRSITGAASENLWFLPTMVSEVFEM